MVWATAQELDVPICVHEGSLPGFARIGNDRTRDSIGRHVLGSQVYDYWADPWRRVHEHWADSDRLNLANGSNLVSADEALVSQWGEAPPEKFINHASA